MACCQKLATGFDHRKRAGYRCSGCLVRHSPQLFGYCASHSFSGRAAAEKPFGRSVTTIFRGRNDRRIDHRSFRDRRTQGHIPYILRTLSGNARAFAANCARAECGRSYRRLGAEFRQSGSCHSPVDIRPPRHNFMGQNLRQRSKRRAHCSKCPRSRSRRRDSCQYDCGREKQSWQ